MTSVTVTTQARPGPAIPPMTMRRRADKRVTVTVLSLTFALSIAHGHRRKRLARSACHGPTRSHPDSLATGVRLCQADRP